MSKTIALNPHKCGYSRRNIRLHTISKVCDNRHGVLRSSKEFSTVMKISKELIRVVRVLEGPRANIKILVSNHDLK